MGGFKKIKLKKQSIGRYKKRTIKIQHRKKKKMGILNIYG